MLDTCKHCKKYVNLVGHDCRACRVCNGRGVDVDKIKASESKGKKVNE